MSGSERTIMQLSEVTVRRDGRDLLADVTWEVRRGERWVVLGTNGAGKTTLLRVASLYLHPSAGTVTVLGERLGQTDVRQLRRRIGVCSQALADLLRADLSVSDVVLTGRTAALEPWWHTYTDADRREAAGLLERLGLPDFGRRRFGTLSSGERQRVQLARTLMGHPDLLLLDEPAAGLDLAAREDLVGRLAWLAADAAIAPTVLVTHHLEEIPAGFTHALLLSGGRVLASGPIDEILVAPLLSDCFGVALAVARRDGRWSAWAKARPQPL